MARRRCIRWALAALIAAAGCASPAPEPPPSTSTKSPTEFGIQIHCDGDVAEALRLVRYMNLTWVKQQARWSDLEPAPQRFDWSCFDWSCLDRVVPAAHKAGLKVLVSITTAPPWSRAMHNALGPPDRLEYFGAFVAALLARYPGRIQALELWNEPNLSAEWTDVIDGAKYAQLLAVGYAAAKRAQPDLLVISAALAPTAHGSVWTHVDDLAFLRRMLEFDALNNLDCLGAHANGPDGVGDLPLVAERYRPLAAPKPLCFTEFGYAVPVAGQAPPGFGWIMRHDIAGQQRVLAEWMAHARRSGAVRLAIVFNLNLDGPPAHPNTPYALMRAGWRSPAIEAIRSAAGGGGR